MKLKENEFHSRGLGKTTTPTGTSGGVRRPFQEMGVGKDIKQFRHNHSSVKGVYVADCGRCDHIQSEIAKRAAAKKG